MKAVIELLKYINQLEAEMLAKFPSQALVIVEVMEKWRASFFTIQKSKPKG